jgi:hypothetical protein
MNIFLTAFPVTDQFIINDNPKGQLIRANSWMNIKISILELNTRFNE